MAIEKPDRTSGNPDSPGVTVHARMHANGIILVGDSLAAFGNRTEVRGGKPADIALPPHSLLCVEGAGESPQRLNIDSICFQINSTMIIVLSASRQGEHVILPKPWARKATATSRTEQEATSAKPYEPMVQVNPELERELHVLLTAWEAHLLKERREKQQSPQPDGAAPSKEPPLWISQLLLGLGRIGQEYAKRHPTVEGQTPKLTATKGFLERMRERFGKTKFDDPIDPLHPAHTASVLLEISVKGTVAGKLVPSALRDRILDHMGMLSRKGTTIGEGPYTKTPSGEVRQYAAHVLEQYEFAGVAAGEQVGVSDKKRSLQLGMEKLASENGRVTQQAGFQMVMETIDRAAKRPPVPHGEDTEDKVQKHDTTIAKAIELVVESPFYRELSPTKKRDALQRLQDVRQRVESRGKVKIPPSLLTSTKSEKASPV